MVHERGPQAVTPYVDEFFRRCRDIVVSHDGILDNFQGDAVLAFFNVPIQREDHIARAVRAATQVQQDVPQINAKLGEVDLLKVGIGVTTGLAYTATMGSKDCKDYTAMGDVVNIGARLQGLAAAGEILVSEDVYWEVRDQFPNAGERVLELKGITEPVRAYSLANPAVKSGHSAS